MNTIKQINKFFSTPDKCKQQILTAVTNSVQSAGSTTTKAELTKHYDKLKESNGN